MLGPEISILFVVLILLLALIPCWFVPITIRLIAIKRKRPLLLNDGIPFRRILRIGDYYKSFPPHLIILLLLNEDEKFWSHRGFNFSEIWRAIVSISRDKQIRGGSSISQQVAKLLLPRFSSIRKHIARKMVRKVLEIPTTILIENFFTKQDILSIYLQNVMFFGGLYGIEGASKAFLSKDYKDLTVAESQVLISLIPWPRTSHLRQFKYPPHHWKRFNYCLAYEKIILTIRLLKLTPQLIPSELSFSIISKASSPLLNKNSENNLIREVTGIIHQIPEVLSTIESITKKHQLFLHSALDNEYCILLHLLLNSSNLNREFVEKSIGQANISLILQRSLKHGIIQFWNTQDNCCNSDKTIMEAAIIEQRSIIHRNEAAMQEFERIVELLSNQVPEICVGGDYYLLAHCYPIAGKRSFQSLMLVVDSDSMTLVEGILKSTRLRAVGQLVSNNRQNYASNPPTQYRSELSDLRVTLISVNNFAWLKGVKARCTNETLQSGTVFSNLSPRDELLIRVARQVNFRPTRLIEVQDICKIIRSSSLDIKSLLEDTDKSNTKIAILLASILGLLHIPSEVDKNPFRLIEKHRDELAEIFDGMFIDKFC